MDETYITDLRHLIDISKTEVYIEVSSCFKYYMQGNTPVFYYNLCIVKL
jgi:hypothetical protein